MLNHLDLSRVKVRLETIRKKATKALSFEPSEAEVRTDEFYMSSTMSCLENFGTSYDCNPSDISIMDEWTIYAYDESVQNFRALEGDLMFCSASVLKMDERYSFSLEVLPHFVTSMKKFEDEKDEAIRYTARPAEERNLIMVKAKTESLLRSVEPGAVVLIDGPLVGGMASYFMREMDEELRRRNCIPIYFVKNSDSRLVIDAVSHTNPELSREYNGDFHWAAHRLKAGSRSAFFRYTDRENPQNTKVFSYMKAMPGFPQRIEMHPATYEKYLPILTQLLNLTAYFYLVQGDYSNPQVRPVAVAEKYAREGLRILNIPVLLGRLGFQPTINQVRFG